MLGRAHLLRTAVSLVREHGFTRETLANSVLHLSNEPRSEPLSDSAVSILFGEGDNARRVLIGAWLEEGRTQMRSNGSASAVPSTPNLKEALYSRLRYNEPVLSLLPEVA